MNKVLEVLKRIAVLVLSGVAAALAAARPSPAAPAPSPCPRATSATALYLTTRDGTEPAVDVWYLQDLKRGKGVPALARFTRYARALESGLAGRALLGLGYGWQLAPADEPTATPVHLLAAPCTCRAPAEPLRQAP